MLIGHGGNIYDLAARLGCQPFEIIDMSSNVNPLGPMPGLIAFLKENLDAINALPEVDARTSVGAFAARYGIDPDRVLAGNGSTQFIYALPKVLETLKALIVGPTYADYADACSMHRCPYSHMIVDASQGFKPDFRVIETLLDGVDTVFLCNPNNPTGVLAPAAQIEDLCKAHPDTRFIIDESYLPFAGGGEKESMIYSGLANVIVLNSMSKIFKIPGLRIGFLIAPETIIKKFVPFMLPWSVNSLAQAAVTYLMSREAEVTQFIKDTRNYLETEKLRFTEEFGKTCGMQFFPSSTSFLLARLSGSLTAEGVCGHLAQRRILIRNCSNFKGLSNRFVRISLKTREINSLLRDKLSELAAALVPMDASVY